MKAMSFKGQSILVTGASSGLGKEIATCLARDHGANLVISARREDRLQELADELAKKFSVTVEVCAADLGLETDVDKLFEFCTQDRTLYGAILNAGITHFGKWDELDFESFRKMQAVNNTCVVKLASALLPYFEERAVGGGLMFVASHPGSLSNVLFRNESLLGPSRRWSSLRNEAARRLCDDLCSRRHRH